MRTQVFVFMGMVASGKSYLAERVVSETGCHYFNSDVVRKEIAGLAAEDRQWLPVDSGLYSPEMSRKTYDALLAKCRGAIAEQVPFIILDGSYNKEDERNRVIEALGDLCTLRFIYCYCAKDVAYKRMNIRKDDDEAVSDGRPLIYEHQVQTYELPDELEGDMLISLDTDDDVAVLVKRVLSSLD